MPDNPNLPVTGASSPLSAWSWRFLAVAGLCLAICLTAALYGPLARIFDSLGAVWGWGPGAECQSRAILEVADPPPIGGGGDERLDLIRVLLADKERSPAAMELPTLRIRMLSWNACREAVLSRRVDFGSDIDPDDRRQLEAIHQSICQRIRVEAVGPRHIAVSHRSPSPTRNASLVNELVRICLNAERCNAQDQAKQDLKYYREKYSAAQARRSEVDAQIQEFVQANPWLREKISDLHAEYKDWEEKERVVMDTLGEKEAEIAKLRNDLKREAPEMRGTREQPQSDEAIARWSLRTRKSYLWALGDIERATNANVAETLTRLGEAMSRLQEAQKPVDEAMEARKAVQLLEAYLQKVKDRGKAPDGNYEQVIRRLEETMAAVPQLRKLAETKETEETRPNPRYDQIQTLISTGEKEIEKLNRRKLAVNRRVNELYVLVRRGPELMAQRRRLDEDRAAAASIAEDYGKFVRQAEKELQWTLVGSGSSRFRVVEYAREDSTPVYGEGGAGAGEAAVWGAEWPERGGGPGTGLATAALVCAVGILIGASPVLVLLLRGNERGPKAEAAGQPLRAARGLPKVGIACLIVFILFTIAALVLYLRYKRVARAGAAGGPEISESRGSQAPAHAVSARELQVESFHAGAHIRFNQIDPLTGLVTTSTHVFCELPPDNPRAFTVETEDETHGKIRLYRLRNVGTGESLDFSDVPVRKIGTAGWAIEAETGWKIVRDQLQAKMKVQLALPIVGR